MQIACCARMVINGNMCWWLGLGCGWMCIRLVTWWSKWTTQVDQHCTNPLHCSYNLSCWLYKHRVQIEISKISAITWVTGYLQFSGCTSSIIWYPPVMFAGRGKQAGRTHTSSQGAIGAHQWLVAVRLVLWWACGGCYRLWTCLFPRLLPNRMPKSSMIFTLEG